MKTAVKWLEDQVKTSKHYFKLMEDIQSKSTVAQSNIFEQAKEMEKEQITYAHLIGLITSMEMEATKQAEHYYNETYKQD